MLKELRELGRCGFTTFTEEAYAAASGPSKPLEKAPFASAVANSLSVAIGTPRGSAIAIV